MNKHELKILPQHFIPVLDGHKTAELRKNDRNYQVGDTLLLMEWNGEYTGDACERVITHIADVGEWLPGYMLLSIERIPQHAPVDLAALVPDEMPDSLHNTLRIVLSDMASFVVKDAVWEAFKSEMLRRIADTAPQQHEVLERHRG